MGNLSGLTPNKVFEFFEEICAIPRGSGNMEKIGDYCLEFANKRSLKSYRDQTGNVVIFKEATKGYENSETVMLQGHMDIVCQKIEGLDFDFEKDAIIPYVDGEYIKAKGTTLGADNGIAMAMIMAILDDDSLEHPAIEAVFTTDEETGMEGAIEFCCDGLKSKKMINLDAEEPENITVSCASGSDFEMFIPLKRKNKQGKCIELVLDGLSGGHSGVEIHSGRVNADILAGRILNYLNSKTDFDIVSIDGGNKANAIPSRCVIKIVAQQSVEETLEEYLKIVKTEISAREPNFKWSINICEGEFEAIETPSKDQLVFMLLLTPNGVMQMSADIEGLVETSLNLGILKTDSDEMYLKYMLRSNKSSSLKSLEEKMITFSSCIECKIKSSGHNPPWEFKKGSKLQEICKEAYKEKLGFEPKIVAIHAGLECGVFADKIDGLDCVAIGPELKEVHTPNERIKISTVGDIFECVLEILRKCK